VNPACGYRCPFRYFRECKFVRTLFQCKFFNPQLRIKLFSLLLLTFSIFSSISFVFSLMSFRFCKTQNETFKNILFAIEKNVHVMCQIFQSHIKKALSRRLTVISCFYIYTYIHLYLYNCLFSIKIIARCCSQILQLCDTCMPVYYFRKSICAWCCTYDNKEYSI
jgi:hypothetical protein